MIKYFLFILIIVLIYIHYRNANYRNSYLHSFYFHKLMYYEEKYKKCNNSYNILYCGNKYEGFKKEQIDYNPYSFYITNLSRSIKVNKYSKNMKCYNSEIIIAITSAPNYYLQRESFRHSYNKYLNNTAFFFFTGLSKISQENSYLLAEQKHFNDIVIFNFISSYYNSSMLMVLLMKWTYKKCKKYRYLIYHTSDVYFNVNLFFKKHLATNYNFIAKLIYKAKVIRYNNSRFFIPYSIYNRTYFPTYPSGPFIAFSLNVTKCIALFDYSKIPNIWIDDVVIGMVFEYLNIKGKNIENICNTYPINHYLPSFMYISISYLYIHSLPPGSIFYLHNII